MTQALVTRVKKHYKRKYKEVYGKRFTAAVARLLSEIVERETSHAVPCSFVFGFRN